MGGRSIFWGRWSPRLLDSETTAWPAAVPNELNVEKLANGDNGYFRQSGQQIGVIASNDYIFGDLHRTVREQVCHAISRQRQ